MFLSVGLRIRLVGVWRCALSRKELKFEHSFLYYGFGHLRLGGKMDRRIRPSGYKHNKLKNTRNSPQTSVPAVRLPVLHDPKLILIIPCQKLKMTRLLRPSRSPLSGPARLAPCTPELTLQTTLGMPKSHVFPSELSAEMRRPTERAPRHDLILLLYELNNLTLQGR